MYDLYCEKCGTKLEKQLSFVKFDFEFGYKLYHMKCICPNRKHFWDGHDKYFWSHASYPPDTTERSLFYSDEGVLRMVKE